MSNELRSLTWKYFWEQKVEEITRCLFWVFMGILGIAMVVLVPYLLGHFIGDNISPMCGPGVSPPPTPCNNYLQWLEGFLYIIVTGMILYTLIDWFSENWGRASERAERDLKKRRVIKTKRGKKND